MSGWFVNFAGLVFIGLIVWWFWLSRPRALHATGSEPVEIVVENGVYTPARIEVAAGVPVILRFLRKDASACAEKVMFDELGIVEELPLGRTKDVAVTLPRAGEYEFTCEMKMYRGRLVAG